MSMIALSSYIIVYIAVKPKIFEHTGGFKKFIQWSSERCCGKNQLIDTREVMVRYVFYEV